MNHRTPVLGEFRNDHQVATSTVRVTAFRELKLPRRLTRYTRRVYRCNGRPNGSQSHSILLLDWALWFHAYNEQWCYYLNISKTVMLLFFFSFFLLPFSRSIMSSLAGHSARSGEQERVETKFI